MEERRPEEPCVGVPKSPEATFPSPASSGSNAVCKTEEDGSNPSVGFVADSYIGSTLGSDPGKTGSTPVSAVIAPITQMGE